MNKAGRPPIEDINERKKAFMVSLTPNEADQIKDQYSTLTKALLTLLRRKNVKIEPKK